MAGRGATTFQKRQREQARKEKREAKIARRQQKKEGINPLEAPLEHEPIDELLGPPEPREETV